MSGSAGFTLIELLLVCAITALMLSLTAPVVLTSLDKRGLTAAQRALIADLRLAQHTAQRSGKKARLVLSSGGYQVQSALTGAATDDCTDTAYQAIKIVSVHESFRVNLVHWSLPCLVFEPSGRITASNPIITETLTTASDAGVHGWTQFFNGVYVEEEEWVLYDPQANKWTSGSNDLVRVTVDLGVTRFVTNVCASVLEDFLYGDDIPFPTLIRLDYADQVHTVPQEDDWIPLATISTPYPGVDGTGTPGWRRACPSFEVNRQIRYFRLLFEPGMDAWGSYRFALDEIKIDPPSITLQNESGRFSRKISITPVTGRVTVQ